MEENVRPFYGEYAWAYDLLLARPAERVCDGLIKILGQRGVNAASNILDAGCGTGSYALELARRGYLVTGLDLSATLLSQARQRLNAHRLPVSLVRGTILSLPFKAQFDALLCRGVLNDLLDDESRESVFISFASALRERGVLVFDVREWRATVERKTLEPLFETCVETPQGRLTFRSRTQLNHSERKLLVAERHALDHGSGETISDYNFVMRCWTQDELERNLTRAGFHAISYLGDYDLTIPAGTNDRLVCVAHFT